MVVAGNTSGLTYHMDDKDIEEALETFLDMGFTDMEIGHSYPIRSLKKFSGRINFRSYHHYTECFLDTEFEKFQKELSKPLEICEEMDVEFLSFHPFFENSFEKAVRNLSKLNERIGPEILVENATKGSDRRMVVTPEDFQKVRDVDNNIGLLLDVGHAQQIGVEKFLKFRDSIKEVHLQDAFSGKTEIHHLPLGAGELNFEFMEELKDKLWVLELKYSTEELLEISRMKAERML